MTLRLISHHIHPHIHTYTHTHIHTYTHTHAHPFPVDSIVFFLLLPTDSLNTQFVFLSNLTPANTLTKTSPTHTNNIYGQTTTIDFQYLVIDDCESETNQILTVLGFAHICFQPYFTHILNSSLTKSHTVLTMYVPVLRMCLIGGFLLFLRWVLSDVDGWRSALPIGEANDQGHNFGVSTEWLRGEKLCTFSGKYHLSWAVPMTDVSYYVPSAQIHSFLMFMPFFVIRTGFIIQGLFLLLTGPVLAAYISPSMFEQASIWCFFSIAQIAIMLFLIRATLLKGDDTADKKVSKKKTPEQPYIKYILGERLGRTSSGQTPKMYLM